MDEISIVTEVTGAEVQEPAEPVEPKRTADEAFA